MEVKKNLKKHSPPQILGKYCPDCTFQGKHSSLGYDKCFKRISTQVKTFSKLLALDKLFSKTVFFRNISKPVRDVGKNTHNQICRSLNFTLIRSALFSDFSNKFRDIWVHRIAKITPHPKLWGIILVKLYCLGEVIDSRP